ncbi:MAG TPA: sulfatase, partial [bacterium]|nr:sulfatase [bacterium]
ASALPLIACLLALGSAGWSRRLRFVTSPWTAAALLTGLPWLTVHALSAATRGPKTAGVLLFPAALLLLAFLVQRILRSRSQVPTVLTTLTVLLAAILLDHTAHVLAPQPPPAADDEPDRPNVLMIIMDTVRADHLSLYGYERETSPHLEELARRATVYRRSVASGDMTLTTHASLFTGLYGRTHGAHRSPMTPAGRPLDRSFLTLAEMTATRDYWNAAVVANRGYVTPHFGFDQGFHQFDSRGPVAFLGHPIPYYLRRGVRTALVPFVPRAAYDRVVRSAEQINREAIAQLNHLAERDGPFFLFVNYMDAHNPYLPPAPYDTMFPGKDPTFTSVRYGRLMWEMNKKGLEKISRRDREHITSQYDGAIAYEDAAIARLLSRLEDLGLWDETLIVITSDHGEALGDRFLVNHGVSVYQDQVGVPLVVKYPGQSTGRTVDVWTNSVDVLPTVLGATGLPVPDGLPGRDLAGLGIAPGAPGEDRAVVAESFPTGAQARFHRMERALYAGRHKLIVNTEGKQELYDLVADPDESVNLFAESAVTDSMQARLDAWLETTAERNDSTAVAELDDEMRARLQALGYLD